MMPQWISCDSCSFFSPSLSGQGDAVTHDWRTATCPDCKQRRVVPVTLGRCVDCSIKRMKADQ